jgi:alpha-tubulin suppressor-like RCC1 family protein
MLITLVSARTAPHGHGDPTLLVVSEMTTIVEKSSPVSVVGGFTDWVQVSGGSNHSIGIRADGTAWGWGRDNTGQLGDNSTVNQSSPVSVVGGFTDWVK